MTDRVEGRGYGLGMSYDERKQLEDKLTTSALVNAAARKQGALGDHEKIDVTGDDASRAELHDDYKRPFWDRMVHPKSREDRDAGFEGAREFGRDLVITLADAAEPGAELIGAAEAGAALGVASPFITFVGLLKSVHEDWVEGKKENAALLRDQMHLGLLGSVDGLPECYRKAEIEHRGGMGSENGPVARMAATLRGNAAVQRLLQIRTDDGMHQAFSVPPGTDPLGFLKSAGLDRRYHEDAAFRMGFDSILYARKTANGETTKDPGEIVKARIELERAREELFARDKGLRLERTFVPGKM
jgi:hypothetical protein